MSLGRGRFELIGGLAGVLVTSGCLRLPRGVSGAVTSFRLANSDTWARDASQGMDATDILLGFYIFVQSDGQAVFHRIIFFRL